MTDWLIATRSENDARCLIPFDKIQFIGDDEGRTLIKVIGINYVAEIFVKETVEDIIETIRSLNY